MSPRTLRPIATLQPFEFGALGARLRRPATPVRFDSPLLAVTIDGIEHQFDHPVGEVLSKIVGGERFSVTHLQRAFYALRMLDFVDIFSSTKYVLGALEVGCPPQTLMASKLNGMVMASRWRDAGQRARFVQRFCAAISSCGFVPSGAA